jgi:bacteriocin-like protein
MRELKKEELKQVSGGASANWTEETSTKGGGGNPRGSGVGLIETTLNHGGQEPQAPKYEDDVPPPG